MPALAMVTVFPSAPSNVLAIIVLAFLDISKPVTVTVSPTLTGNTLCVASKVDRNDRSTGLLDADHVHSRSHRVAGATLGSLRRRWTSRYINRCHSTCDSNGCRVECPGLCRCS